MCDLSQEQRARKLGEGAAEPDEESAGDEHLEVLRGALHCYTDEEDGAAGPDGGLAAKSVGDVGGKRETGEGANAVDGAEETEKRACGVVEVRLPYWENLETVQLWRCCQRPMVYPVSKIYKYHRAIVARRRGGQAHDHAQRIELAKTSIFPPLHLVELRCFGPSGLDLALVPTEPKTRSHCEGSLRLASSEVREGVVRDEALHSRPQEGVINCTSSPRAQAITHVACRIGSPG